MINIIKKFAPNMFKDREGKVLLHDAETCMECSKTFLSLFPIKDCTDHEGLENI